MSYTITYPSTDNMFADTKPITLQKILQELNGGGSTGGSSSFGRQVYMDRAPAAPDNPSIPALSYDSPSGSIQQWRTDTQAWQ